jgi:hypothetical protein
VAMIPLNMAVKFTEGRDEAGGLKAINNTSRDYIP